MTDSAAKKTNGGKRQPVGCPVYPECDVSVLMRSLVEDTERQLAEQGDAIAEAIGRVDQQLRALNEQHSNLGNQLAQLSLTLDNYLTVLRPADVHALVGIHSRRIDQAEHAIARLLAGMGGDPGDTR